MCEPASPRNPVIVYSHSYVPSGEAIIITRNGVTRRQVGAPATFAPDIFEYVYFARPDSVLDGVSVYRSRMAMGDALADEVKRVLAEKNITVDVVIPVCTTCLWQSVERVLTNDVLFLGSRYFPCRSFELGSEAKAAIPRRIHQKPLCWADIYHAWTANEVSRQSV